MNEKENRVLKVNLATVFKKSKVYILVTLVRSLVAMERWKETWEPALQNCPLMSLCSVVSHAPTHTSYMLVMFALSYVTIL